MKNNINNAASSKIKIKLNMNGGMLRGNIIDAPVIIVSPPTSCVINGLDFSCSENSQYIGAI